MAVDARGTLTGNRGVLHDEHKRIVRLSNGRRWIVCLLEYKGMHREVMTPRRWTELFFLDEATALAAGHRPCAYCRRDAFNRFAAAWSSAHGGSVPRATEMDDRLHVDRRRRYEARAAELPDGTFVLIGEQPHRVQGGKTRPWTFHGYESAVDLRPGPVTVLTPEATVPGSGHRLRGFIRRRRASEERAQPAEDEDHGYAPAS